MGMFEKIDSSHCRHTLINKEDIKTGIVLQMTGCAMLYHCQGVDKGLYFMPLLLEIQLQGISY